jgi:hypothetical protein
MRLPRPKQSKEAKAQRDFKESRLQGWLKFKLVRIDDLRVFTEGCHGMYCSIGDGIGVKCFKHHNSFALAQHEFLITSYLQSHPLTRGLTTKALAYGYSHVEINGRSVSRPVIWMEHIRGINLYDYSVQLGMDLNPDFDVIEARRVGHALDVFQRHLYRASEIHALLKETGYSAWDHEQDHNFMLLEDGRLIAIDFRPDRNEMVGRISEDKAFMNNIYKECGHMKPGIPPDLMTSLLRLGLYV